MKATTQSQILFLSEWRLTEGKDDKGTDQSAHVKCVTFR